MCPRLPGASIRFKGTQISQSSPRITPVCMFCRLSRTLSRGPRRIVDGLKVSQDGQRSKLSHDTKTSIRDSRSSATIPEARLQLREALLDLHRDQSAYVNLGRLQLALRGLQRYPGEETIRIAVLALANVGESFKKAKELLRLFLADPLNLQADWEQRLLRHRQGDRPLLIKVGHDAEGTEQVGNLMEELHVQSSTIHAQHLEILLLEVDPTSSDGESMLSPIANIPVSSTGRVTSIILPVHKALIVGDGILGATSLLTMSNTTDRYNVISVADIKSLEDQNHDLPLITMDTTLGRKAIESMRSGPSNALAYEHDWFASKVPDVFNAFKAGFTSSDGSLSPLLQSLIESLLSSTRQRIENAREQHLQAALSAKLSSKDLKVLEQDLSEWAEKAHVELQTQLEIAFSSSKWARLSWWKLFWRVDDVSMLFTDILEQHYLFIAEKDSIYLAGVIGGKGDFKYSNCSPQKTSVYRSIPERYDAPPPLHQHQDGMGALLGNINTSPWPQDIAASRRQLCLQTIPALQSLAQRLVLQTYSTSSVSGALAGLLYVSSLPLGLYEVGAVAALGAVWSLRRMQQKWEAAREFWKGKVQEEGRRALRGVEIAIGAAIRPTNSSTEMHEELEAANLAVTRAQIALKEACK